MDTSPLATEQIIGRIGCHCEKRNNKRDYGIYRIANKNFDK